jgi:hypothetical protein
MVFAHWHLGRMASHNVVWNVFVIITKNAWFHVSWYRNMSSAPYLAVFMLLNWHCVISQWCSHIGTWGEDDLTWCCERCFCCHCKKCRISCFAEQTHVLLPPTLQSSRCWINIVLLVNGVHMLADIVIINLIRVHLVSWVAFSYKFVVIVTT